MTDVRYTTKKLKEMRKKKEVLTKHSTSELKDEYAVNGWKHDNEAITNWPVSQSPFEHLYIDVTHRCNMACNVCYNPIRTIPDMDLQWYEEKVKKLPQRTELVLLGGEPTLHKDFFEFINIAYKNNHSVYIPTNGKKIARDKNFCKEIQKINQHGRMKIYTDMSGGIDEPGFGGENSVYYQAVHNEDSYPEKIQMIENLKDIKFKRLTVSAIIIRNLNEKVMPDMFELYNRYPLVIREIAYKSQGKIGRYVGNDEPYYTNEWLHMMIEQGLATYETISRVVMNGTKDKRCKGKNCCYYYMHDRRLMVSWLDFLTKSCWKRGQLIEGTDQVEYMFESLQANDFNKLFK